MGGVSKTPLKESDEDSTTDEDSTSEGNYEGDGYDNSIFQELAISLPFEVGFFSLLFS